MVTIGGPGNNTGTFVGTALVIIFRRLLIIFKWNIQDFVWFPISFLEEQILAVFLIIVMIFKPNGLIPEKLLRIPGINYRKLVREETAADWRTRKTPDESKGPISGRRNKTENGE